MSFTAGQIVTAADLNAIANPLSMWRLVIGSTAQSIPQNTFTTLSTNWVVGADDPGNDIGITYANGLFTVSVAGRYKVDVLAIAGSGAGAGTYQTRLAVNGSAKTSASGDFNPDGTGVFAMPSMSIPLLLAAEDEVSVQVQHNVSGNQSIGGTGSYFAISYEGPS